MVINHNMSSINANNVLKFKTVDVTRDAQKLASGLKLIELLTMLQVLQFLKK